jgi:hypothetical protein
MLVVYPLHRIPQEISRGLGDLVPPSSDLVADDPQAPAALTIVLARDREGMASAVEQ